MIPELSPNAQILRHLIDSTLTFTAQERIRCKNIWKELHNKERYNIIESTLFQITLDMIEKKKFDGEEIKLSKFLTLQFTIEQAINTHLTNYLAFISVLIRNRSMNLRALLNQMTDCINKYSKDMDKNNKERIKDFRALETKDDSVSGQENDYYYPRKVSSHYEDDYELATQEEVGREQRIKSLIQIHKAKTMDNQTINFNRTTKF